MDLLEMSLWITTQPMYAKITTATEKESFVEHCNNICIIWTAEILN